MTTKLKKEHFNIALTEEQQEELKAIWNDYTIEDLAKKFNLCKSSISNYAIRLRLTKRSKAGPKYYLKKVGSDKAECRQCQQVKSLQTEFAKRRAVCKTCTNKRVNLKIKSSFDNYWNYRHLSLKMRANKTKIPFDLTPEDLKELWNSQQGKCFYTDREMSWGDAAHRRNLVTIDKIDIPKGYTKGNIVLCTWLANSVKTDLTLEELKEWIPSWYKRINEKTN